MDADEFDKAEVIGVYKACFGEVETDDIFLTAQSRGKTVLYPRTDRKQRKLDFGVVKDIGSLVPGEYDIPEPARDSEWVSPGEIDLLIMPGVAFDRQGGRLGMGGGYYDRILAKLEKNTVRMGLAYEFQIVDHVPLDEYDERVDCLVTESGILRFTERG